MNPYSALPERNFWSPAVGKRSALQITDLWTPKWEITPDQGIATFGSCFAQHFSRALVQRGYNWVNHEPGPQELAPSDAALYNYGIFSARTGNIYTARMLEQWTGWSVGGLEVPHAIWETNGRSYDPFRPAIEPDGFDSPDEVFASRRLAIRSFGDAIAKSGVFVFTMGLTESWIDLNDGFEYAICPGTVAGEHLPERHGFHNARYGAIMSAMQKSISMMREVNPGLRILLTVSPVPLTATASTGHVLVATTYSKSTLRAVAGDLADCDPLIDYFPSYEIITAPPYGGMFHAENKRSVLQAGVDHVMAQFFDGQAKAFAQTAADPGQKAAKSTALDDHDDADLVCEEALLNAFAPKG